MSDETQKTETNDGLTVAKMQAAVSALKANDGTEPAPLLTREEMAEPLTTEIETEETSFKQFHPAVQVSTALLDDGQDISLDAIKQRESIIKRAEEAIVAAAEVVEHVAEEIVTEAETLATEAVTEVKKVWNKHLQAWV